MKTKNSIKFGTNFLRRVGLSFVFFISLICIAGGTIGSVASGITGTMGDLAKLATAGAFVAGFGFAVAAILKFKAHKDNPTQIPIGTPIALLLIAVALIFVPTVFGVTGQTLFGSNAAVGTISGITSFSTGGGGG